MISRKLVGFDSYALFNLVIDDPCLFISQDFVFIFFVRQLELFTFFS